MPDLTSSRGAMPNGPTGGEGEGKGGRSGQRTQHMRRLGQLEAAPRLIESAPGAGGMPRRPASHSPLAEASEHPSFQPLMRSNNRNGLRPFRGAS
jgi:hypothetical protein